MPDNGNSIGKLLTNNYVWRSIFRHGYADTPRNRVLQVSANVWLHLHPSKMPGFFFGSMSGGTVLQAPRADVMRR